MKKEVNDLLELYNLLEYDYDKKNMKEKAIKELESDMEITQYWINEENGDIYFEYIPDAALWGQGVFDVIAGRDKKWLLRLKYDDIYLYLKND